MKLITLDFETAYTNDLGFKKQTTEEYINDPRFEVIGVGVKIDDDETQWYSGSHEDVGRYLKSLDIPNNTLLCHNTMFDGAILSWRFGIEAQFYLDTLSMARALHGVDAGGSLKALAERYEIGVKGTEVNDAFGKFLKDFPTEDLARYGEYCRNDVDLTFILFQQLVSKFPVDELKLIDMTLRMFIVPKLEVDDALLQSRLTDVQKEKSELLASVAVRLGCSTDEEVRKKLASNKQFAELLQEFGVEPPMKMSKTTGKQTYALAKNDQGFLDLQGHEDLFVQQLCAVRLGTKSTIEESRIERFINVGARNKGKIPIPLKYYGAHTGRWAGSEAVNFQNLPSRDKKKKALKSSIVAPEGYYIINCDSSQIEARVLAWLAGEEELVEAFANGEDVYCKFASVVYDREITKADPIERFVGKTCTLGLGYGTGAAKLQHTLKTTPPGVDVDDEEAKRLVTLYRETNKNIIKLWNKGDIVLKRLANWGAKDKPIYYGNHKCLKVYKQGIKLPNGLFIRYPNLQYVSYENGNSGYEYKSRKGDVSIWGGSLVENVVQALARIIVGQQMLEIVKRYPVVLTVHDAAVCLVKKEEVEEALEYITGVMSTPPSWAEGLPVACEATYSEDYGGC